MTNNETTDDPEIDCNAIFTEIVASCDDPSMEEFEPALTTVVDDLENTLTQDEIEGRIADATVAALIGRETQFSRRMREREDRRAPYVAEEAARMRYDDPDWISDMTPAAFAEDGEGDDDE